MRNQIVRALVLWTFLAAVSREVSAANPAFIALDSFYPTAISASGRVLVGNSAAGDPARWTIGVGVESLGVAPDHSAIPWAVSADGSVIVGESWSATDLYGFRWTAATGMVSLGYLPGHTMTRAYGVSADGSVVVGRSYGLADEQGFRWTSAAMISLGARSNLGSDVSDDGSIVVGFTENVGNNDPAHRFSATRWKAATGIVPIGDIWLGDLNTGRPSPYISPRISGDGSVVVGVISGAHPQAARYLSDGRTIALGTLPGEDFGYAVDVSRNGSIIVGESRYITGTDPNSGYPLWGSKVFIWDAQGGMRDLQQVLGDLGVHLEGWQLGNVTGISADGLTIVGLGLNPAGNSQGWMVTIPEPACILFALPMCLLLRRTPFIRCG